MSQYQPPNGHGGQYHGQPPLQQHSYGLPQNYPFQPYNPPYNPGVAEAPGSTVQSSFNYNASHIPGLRIAGGPGDRPLDHALASQAWMQAPGLGANSQPTLQPTMTPAAGGFGGFPVRASSLNQAQGPVAHPPAQPAASAAHAALNSDIEEGELSEGQFEDLYEPRESVEPAVIAQDHSKPHSAVPAVNDSSGVASVADTPDAGFYANDDEEAGSNANRKVDRDDSRERSGSYSPFLSPRETPNDHASSRGAGEIAENQTSTHPTQGTAAERKQVLPGLQLGSQSSQSLQNRSATAESVQSAFPSPREPLARFGSLEEGRKEARKAILRLWSMGVRFQNYIDEGFDDKVIKSLFKDLNLDISNMGGLAQATKKDAQPDRRDLSGPSKPEKPVQEQQPKKAEPAAPPTSKKGEERKDRIARLLAAKAAKPAAPPPQQQPPTKPQPSKAQEKPFAPPTAPAAMTRSKTWGEKELLLQQKIAALAEAQARKATKGISNSASSQTALKDSKPSAPTPPENGRDLGLAPPNSAPAPSQVPSELGNSQPSSSIPGLLLSTIPSGPARNQRKRPVASDFVEIPTGPRAHKRPFGHSRQETNLVIDVSDGSDGEEMDIDMESPLEDSPSFSPFGPSSQRGPAIRDFPPLTDTLSQRQFSSPVPPSSNTPLGKPILSRKRETELDIKEKAIQEMRRKIAEAEARRQAKKSSGGSQTPNPAESTPELGDSEQFSSSGKSDEASARPAQQATSVRESEASPQVKKADRRGRIVSLDLPKIDETLEEKMKRLRQLREEELRLEAEINRQLAAKKMLTEELEELGDSSSPSDGKSQPNGLSSDEASAAPNPGEASGSQQTPSAPASNDYEGNDAPGDISMDEDDSSVQPSQGQSPLNEPAVGEITHDDLSTKASEKASENLPNNQTPVLKISLGDTSNPQETADEPAPVGSAHHADTLSVDVAPNAEAHHQASQRAGTVESDDPAPMELDSPSPTSSVGPTKADRADDERQQTRQSPVTHLDQISNAQTREEVQEIEETAAREVHVVSSLVSQPLPLTALQVNPGARQPSKSTFVPYSSPLRYFHAYRFHPSYTETVPGGLKSLTYSNKINPEKPFCPFELSGEQCPPKCEFQHFGNIATPNEQILLQLGKSDDYTGEQKSRFIQGLRKLLQDIRKQPNKDFDAIAREIIAYRARFLGDKSKVLPLEGVTL